MYFDVTFGIFLSLKRLFVGENFHLRNSTLTVTILALHGSLSKIEGELFLLQKSGRRFSTPLLRTDRGGPQQRIGNISRPAAAETCPPGRAKNGKGAFQ